MTRTNISFDNPSRQADPHYTGVARDRHPWKMAKPWKAWAWHDRHRIWLGYFRTPELAAWAADLARYLIHGFDAKLQHHKQKYPNFPPHRTLEVPRVIIVSKLLRDTDLDAGLIRTRLSEYDKRIV